MRTAILRRRRRVAPVVPVVGVPGSIGDLTATAQSTTSVLLEFTAAPDATGHQYRVDGGAWSTAPVDGIVTGLSAGTEYGFQVRGTNEAGAGPASNTASETTNYNPPVYDDSIGAQSWQASVAITPLDVGAAFTGATSYSVTGLPAGLSLNTSTGVITGTPSVEQSATDFTVTGTGPGGSDDAVISATVAAAPSPPVYDDSIGAQTWTEDEAITPLDVGAAFTGADSYSVTGLPAGLSMNTTTGIITGTPTVPQAATNFTVTGTGPGGTDDAVISATVEEAAGEITYVTSSSAAGSGTGTLPIGYTTGDFIDGWAAQTTDGTNVVTKPTDPADWLQVTPAAGPPTFQHTVQGAGAVATFAHKFVNEGTETGGTWANAASIHVGIYRGVDPANPIIEQIIAQGASNSIDIPALPSLDESARVVAHVRTQNAVQATITAAEASFTAAGFTIRLNSSRRLILDGPMSSFAGLSVPIAGAGKVIVGVKALRPA